MRRPVLVALVCLIACAAASVPAGAATPTLKRQFAPLDTRIRQIGAQAGAGLSAKGSWTFARRASYFGSLAQRTIAVSQAVGELSGATGPMLVRQRRLQLALAQGAIDLSGLSAAGRLHSPAKEAAAARALRRDAPPIQRLRRALAQALGLGA